MQQQSRGNEPKIPRLCSEHCAVASWQPSALTIYYHIAGNLRGRRISQILSVKLGSVVSYGSDISEQSAKVFSLEIFPLYGMCNALVVMNASVVHPAATPYVLSYDLSSLIACLRMELKPGTLGSISGNCTLVEVTICDYNSVTLAKFIMALRLLRKNWLQLCNIFTSRHRQRKILS